MLYAKLALEQLPRILGLGDRRPDSRTFGCFDRAYWHYRTTDLANVRFQEACHLLAMAASIDAPGNPFYGEDRLNEWAEAAVRFWATQVHRDGSVDEVYPNERSFCATAFSTMAAAETVRILGLEVPDRLRRSARWLSRNRNADVANQMAAAALALQTTSQLTGDERLARASAECIGALLDLQDADGFFPEYGGYDIGYQTVTLSCLARCQRKTPDIALRSAIELGVRAVEERVDTNGSFSIQGTSRQTQFLYPTAFVVCGSDVVDHHMKGLAENRVLSPAWLDDRYVIQLATDYLVAHEEAATCE